MLKKLTSAVICPVILAAVSHADTFYTIDAANDVLYTIDVKTGVATVVGSLGVDLTNVDLAWHKGTLYASDFGGPTGSRIYQVLTTGMFAGLALSGAPINGGGYQGAAIGGIASNTVSLYIAYSQEAVGGNNSNRFGMVDPLTGLITSPTIIPTDADSLGLAYATFIALDVKTPATGYDLFRGNPPVTYVGNDTYDTTLATNPIDSEYFPPSGLSNWFTIVTVSQSGKNLVRVGFLSGLRGVVTSIIGSGLPSNFVMKGLARSPAPCPSGYGVH